MEKSLTSIASSWYSIRCYIDFGCIIWFSSYEFQQLKLGIQLWSRSKLQFCTAWEMSVFGVILFHIFPHSDWIQKDAPYLSVFSPKCGKMWTRITPNTDTFYAVKVCWTISRHYAYKDYHMFLLLEIVCYTTLLIDWKIYIYLFPWKLTKSLWDLVLTVS